MARRSSRAVALIAAFAAHATACGSFDDRTLHRLGAAAGAAGALSSGAGSGGAGAGNAGSAGSARSDAGEAGSDQPAEGGKANGASGASGATGGTLGAAGSAAGASGSVAIAGASGGTGGAAAGAPSVAGGGGVPGVAGATGNFPCGDINGNAIDDCTETSIVNSRFDSDVAHWGAGFASAQAWDTRDALGKAGSGCILVSNTLPTATGSGLAMTGTGQCVPVEEGAKYEIATRVFLPNGQGGGEAGLNLWVFANADCAGTLLDAATPTAISAVEQWSVVSSKITIVAGAHSLLVRLVAAKPLSQSKLDALFDDVLFKKSL